MTAREPSRAVVAMGKHNGCVLFVSPGSYLEEDVENTSDRLDDLGLDDAPTGVSVWEGTHAGGEYMPHSGDYADTYPVGKFRAPTDDEWSAIRAGVSPWPDFRNALVEESDEVRHD